MSFRLAIAAVGLVALAAPASAQSYYDPGYGYAPGVEYSPGRGPTPRNAPPGYYEGRSVQQTYQDEYQQSGTLGRQGLGADPRHPEGPGNQSLGGVR